jgi:multidrug transporter EmrE-like cation transporter
MLNIVLLSLVEILGDFELKYYARTGTITHLYKGLIGYAMVVYFLIQSLKQYNILIVNGIWDGLSALLESSAAYILLGERLTHTINYIGLLFIIAGLVLLRWKL